MILLLTGKILWNDSKVHIFLEIYKNKMEKINWSDDSKVHIFFLNYLCFDDSILFFIFQ